MPVRERSFRDWLRRAARRVPRLRPLDDGQDLAPAPRNSREIQRLIDELVTKIAEKSKPARRRPQREHDPRAPRGTRGKSAVR